MLDQVPPADLQQGLQLYADMRRRRRRSKEDDLSRVVGEMERSESARLQTGATFSSTFGAAGGLAGVSPIAASMAGLFGRR